MYKVFLMLLTMILSSAVLSETVVTQEIVGDGYLVETETNCKDKKIGSIEYKNCKSSTKTSKIPKAIVVEEPAPKAIVVEEPAPKAIIVEEPAPKAIIVEKPVLKAIPVDEKELSDCDSIDKGKWPMEHRACLAMVEKINGAKEGKEDTAEASDCDSIDKGKWPSEHKRCMTLTEEINKIPKATIVSEEVSPECSVVKFDEISCPEGTYTFTSGKSGASIQDGLLRKAKESTDGQGTLPSRSTGSTSK